MHSPFEDQGNGKKSHMVIVNTAGRYSLWPAFAEVPPGWAVVLSTTSHASCLAHVEQADLVPPDAAGSGDHTTGSPSAPQELPRDQRPL
ncbi:MbtH family protein [Streptomyces sp. NBC_01210]|uniref:MbtH family protein n=1 Tax=Streptomyces sp. NBC_01210 TaxID=2903774 RepID=UPI002E11143F|nr:MbtH family protein [Streptomyces sp. NBC_01210]